MNCPACGAIMRLEPDKDCLTCDYCRNIFFPVKDDDGVSVFPEKSDNNCPVCSAPLNHASMATLRIQYCTQCRGMLIPMAVFLPLVDELRAEMASGALVPPPPDPTELRHKLGCPQCHKPMDTHFYSGAGNVIIESCDTCDLNWLDHGKLLRIVHAPEHSYRDAEPMV
jgi:Zn-finger nucleic acid-binding protein